MNRHELKCWPQYFQAILERRKCFELREDDRDFMVTDRLHLREWSEDTGYTGRWCVVRVTWLAKGEWLADGHVCMSIEPVWEQSR